MIVEDCSFNPVTDVQEVDQFGYVDLAQAFLTGTINADLKVDDLFFNEIDDPVAVSGKPSNVFDMIDAGSAIVNRQEGVQTKSSAKTEGGD